MKDLRVLRGGAGRATDQYDQFSATELYCPNCKQAMPVREQVALYLPSGTIYHYRCQRCSMVLGKKEG